MQHDIWVAQDNKELPTDIDGLRKMFENNDRVLITVEGDHWKIRVPNPNYVSPMIATVEKYNLWAFQVDTVKDGSVV